MPAIAPVPLTSDLWPLLSAMSEPGFTVPAQFLRDMSDVKKLVLGGTRTKGNKFRRRRGGGGGGGSAPAISGRFARVRLTITKASSNLIEDWGGGYVWYLGDETGDWVEELAPVSNRWPIEYPVDAMVRVYGLGDVQGLCGPAPFGFWKVSG